MVVIMGRQGYIWFSNRGFFTMSSLVTASWPFPAAYYSDIQPIMFFRVGCNIVSLDWWPHDNHVDSIASALFGHDQIQCQPLS